MERVPNPLVIEIRPTLKDVDPDIVYLVHTADLAAELYSDFNYLTNKIRENIFWFENENELDMIILEKIKKLQKPNVIVDLDEFKPEGEVYYAQNGDRLYLLNQGKSFHADLCILSKLHRRRVDLMFFTEGSGIGYRQLIVPLKEYGLMDEIYDEQGYLKYLSRFNTEHVLPSIYEYLWQNRPEVIYDLEEPYDNPYENILAVEDYLTNLPIHNLDVNKFEEYKLKYGKLPAKYVYSGLNTTTGRIYCHSDEWAPLPNLQKSKRDVLFAADRHYLVEFDFKSFEFDLLCQILGLPVADDPHTEIFDRLVGVDVPHKRSIGKTINYSFIFGMNEGRLADQVLNEIPDLPRSFRETFLGRLQDEPIIDKLRDFEENLRSTARNGVIQNYFCRNIYYKKEHAILNNYVSSTAADFVYVKFRKILDVLGSGGSILLENHDSILLHLKEDFIDSDGFDRVLDIMKEPVSGLVGRVGISYGKNWRDMV